MDAGGEHERSVGCNVSGVRVSPGGVVRCWTGGGGGHGDPLERDPERVVRDVEQGYVSLDGAARDYGVVITCADEQLNEFTLDAAAAAECRQQRQGRSTVTELVS